MSKKVTASQILKKLEVLHAEKTDPRNLPDSFYSEVKSGPSWGQGGKKLFILDAVAIKKTWTKPCIYGYEIKISRSDFFRGRDTALKQYTKFCHKFSFVCPSGVIKIDELPGDVGLIYYSPEHDVLFEKRRAMYREINLRSPEVVSMLLYLAMYRCGDSWGRDEKGVKSS